MDIWTRLLGGTPPTKRVDDSPQQRLIRFKKVHDQLQLIWRRNPASAKEVTRPEPLLHCLQDAQRILQNEVQSPPPHLCARHVSTFHIYSTMAQLAAIFPDDGIVQEALAIFKILQDSEEGDFLKDKAFADALIGFIGSISAGPLPEKTEAAAMEVLFGVATKLRSEPGLLSTWFRPSKKGWALPSEQQQAHKNEEEFSLFYKLLDYVHRDARTGEFARTGLLYLIEAGARSTALQQWIIESDLATLMASGLGALYSQLSTKLVITCEDDSVPAIASFSQEETPKVPIDADTSTSIEFKAHLNTFLSYLAFWQDVLEHCSSSDVRQSLLDHFKFLFLQQLLYPALMESSDRDGGSSVAVLTYLRCIIESIDHPELVRLTFGYLLALPDVKTEKMSSRPTALARRRRSQSLIASLASDQEQPVPSLFNLNDLVLGNLRSINQQTLTAVLKLVSTMLRSHEQYDVSVINTGQSEGTLSQRTLSDHEWNTTMLYSIIESLIDDNHLKEAYDMHLEEARNVVEVHPCSLQLLRLPAAGQPSNTAKDDKGSSVPNVVLDDPVLKGLLAILEDFFVNDIETNLSLTQVFSTMVSCARRGLNGWFLDSSKEDAHNSTAAEELVFEDHKAGGNADDPTNSTRESSLDLKPRIPTSPLFVALASLLDQVASLRRSIENFDTFLAERRHLFRVSDESETIIKGDLQHTKQAVDPEQTDSLQGGNAPRIGSISERLKSETSTASGSRSQSPRGRDLGPSSTPILVGRLSHLRRSPSRSPAKSGSRAISPSPLRREVSTDSPLQQPSTPMGPPDSLSQKVRLKVNRRSEADISDLRSETSSLKSEEVGGGEGKEVYMEVSLSHILTNVIVLHEFVIELVAMVQVRASLFGEVKFD